MFKIESPFHGAVLNHRHGKQSGKSLRIQVEGTAPPRNRITVNGQPAERRADRFFAEIELDSHINDIVAISDGVHGRQEHSIRVVWDRNSFPRYRFSIDDNSFFLRDIAKQNYKSLFDCFYLANLRDLNRKYGTRFVLNIYYTTEDGFVLPQFPDQYKSEWEDNADWLKLAFHAYANKPDRPYQYAETNELLNHWNLVKEQIIRFAGETSYSPPTVIHWAMLQPQVLKPLYDHGVRVLSGYFCRVATGWDIDYLFDETRSAYLEVHDALMDFESGIVFSKIDLVCNDVLVENIESTLSPLPADPQRAEIMDIFTHEQYFWPFYHDYLPDHVLRLDTAIRWLTERGYKPVFYHEGFLGCPA